jgi:hypothetical protein
MMIMLLSGLLAGYSYAHYVIIEYGIVKLRNKTRRERALELIAIAHPIRALSCVNLKGNFYPENI